MLSQVAFAIERYVGTYAQSYIKRYTSFHAPAASLPHAPFTCTTLLHIFSYMDKLAERERAHFRGPRPILVTALDPDTLAALLSGSDVAETAVEFGAHQVVLTRRIDSNLPSAIRNSNGLIMTIPQAKGLEFDDVLLFNFFADSQAKDAWRVLMTYLDELKAQVGRHISHF